MDKPKVRTLLECQKTVEKRKKALHEAKAALPEGVTFQEAEALMKAAEKAYQKRNRIYEKAGQAIPDVWKRVCVEKTQNAYKAYQAVRKAYDQARDLWRESIWFFEECKQPYHAWQNFMEQENSYKKACESLDMTKTKEIGGI